MQALDHDMDIKDKLIPFGILNLENDQLHVLFLGSLERHWNGALLSTVKAVLEWTKTMTWKAMTPVVNLIDKVYSKGVKLTKNEKEDIENKIIRNSELPKWDLLIIPEW